MKQIQRIISLVLALTMLLSTCPTQAFASEMASEEESAVFETEPVSEEPEETATPETQPEESVPAETMSVEAAVQDSIIASGTCGSALTWTLEDGGILTISGTGAMADYDNFTPKTPWFSYNSQITSAVISEGVTSIGEYAFYQCSKLETVELPDSLESIEFSAFEACESLKDVTLPDDLGSIGSYAFQDCDSLTSFTIPAGVYELGNYIFGYDSNVENIYVDENNPYYCAQDGVLYNKEMTTLVMFPLGRSGEFTTPEGITEIAVAAFEFCSGLERVVISDGVVSIGDSAFASCDNLKSVSIPGSVSEWGYDVFTYSYNLTDVELAEGITGIGDSVFRECSALERISIPETVTFLGLETFSGCSSLKEIRLPENLTTIQPWVFRSSGLENVVLPEGIENIPVAAFQECYALKTIELPENLLMIYDSAFEGSGLTSIAFPEQLNQIRENAFAYCTELGVITFLGKPSFIGKDAFTGVTATCFYYPEDGWTEAEMQNYGGELTWLPYGGTCEGSHTEVIDAGLAPTCTETGLTEGSHCSVCGMILTAQEKIPAAGHTEIADEGVSPTCAKFGLTEGSHCSVCGEILIPQEIIPATGTHSFVDSTCEYCGAISGSQDGNLTWVLNADGTLVISGTGDMKAYSYSKRAPWDSHRDKITSVVLEEGVTSVSDYAFYMCSNLRTVDFPETLTQIGSCAFEECSSLEEILLPDSLTFMDYYAFEDCTSLTEVRIPKGVEELNTYIFRGCENLTRIDVAEDNPRYTSRDGVVYDKEIKTLICYPNGKTGAFTVPEGVETIGENAFYWCTGLTEITIPGHVKTIGDYAFEMCESLKIVTIEEGVESVGARVFSSCWSLNSIVFPDSVTSLGDCVLEASGVVTVKLPEELKRLPYGMFENTPLEVLELPSAMESIGSSAFRNCPLTSLTLPEGLTTIEDSAFAGSYIQNLVYPESLTYFGTGVFSGSWVESIFLPDLLTEIPDWTYDGCDNLTSVVIPDRITRIGDFAFAWCYELREVTIPAGVTEIGSHAFAYLYDYSYEEEGNIFTFEGDAPAFDPEAFLDSTVTCYYPKDNATWTAEVLQDYGGDITWIQKDGVCDAGHTEAVDEAVEATCTENGLTEGKHCTVCGAVLTAQEVIPALGHTEVVDEAKAPTCVQGGQTEGRHCAVCSKVLVRQEWIPATGIHSYVNSVCEFCGGRGGTCGENLNWTLDEQGTLTISGTGAMDNYVLFKNAPWKSYKEEIRTLILEEGITRIGDSAFSGYTALTGELVLPESLTAIGSSAFSGCTGLTGTLAIPEGVTELGQSAFQNCSGFEGELVIAGGITEIPQSAFSGMSGIVTVDIGENVASIGTSSFSNMTSVMKVVFRGKTTLPVLFFGSPFNGMTSLDSIYVPMAHYSSYTGLMTTTLGVPAGARLKPLDSQEEYLISGTEFVAYWGDAPEFTIPEGVTSIGKAAFRNCECLTSVRIPESVSSIGSYAFAGCTGLESIELPEALKTISNHAFYGCSGMKGSLQLPHGLTEIGNNAFMNCAGLTGTLRIPETVKTIGSSAFAGCSGFTGDLVIPNSVTSIGETAFSGCAGFDGALIISDNVTAIPSGAFSGMTGITSITFGENLATIYGGTNTHPFNQMNRVRRVTFWGSTVPALTDDGVSPFLYMTWLETIYVPADAYDAYVAAYENLLESPAEFSTALAGNPVQGLAVSNVYSKTVCLTWMPHTNSRIVGYKIFRDGTEVGTTTECNFADRNLIPGQTYTYSVCGYTEGGVLTAAAKATATPHAPRIQDITNGEMQYRIGVENTIQIHVYDDGNLAPFEGAAPVVQLYYQAGDQEILIGEALRVNDTDPVFTLSWDVSAVDSGEYDLIARITDIDGTTAQCRRTVQVDSRIPSRIEGLSAVGDLKQISLSWAISREADTNCYRIYRRTDLQTEFQLLKEISGRTTLSYLDGDVEKDRTYEYCVTGVDDFGQEGQPSEIVSAVLLSDEEAPQVTKLSPANGGFLSGTVRLSMTAEDNMEVTRGQFHYSVDGKQTWMLLAEQDAMHLTVDFDTTALPDGTIHIKGIAFDAAGNESTPLTYVYAIDNTGPEQVQGLGYESTNVTVTLRWDSVADEDIRYYRVERRNSDGSYAHVSDVHNTLGINLYDLTPETEYIYRVTGYDAQNNRGVPSGDIAVVTKADTTAPVITRIQPGAGYHSSEIPLSVTAVDEYAVGRIRIQLSRDLMTWEDVHTQSVTEISKTGTLTWKLALDAYPEGAIYVRAVAEDMAGNASESGVNAPYVQYLVDRTAPAAPENVAAKGGSGYVEVSWTQGSETDLDKYTVYRADAPEGSFEQVKTGIAATNFIDRNVEPDAVYSYKVTVCDRAGNESAASVVVSAGMAEDTEAPSVISVYPETGATLGPDFRTVSVLAADNRSLGSVTMEYSLDGQQYQPLAENQNVNDYSATVSGQLPLEKAGDGEMVFVRISLQDAAGNGAESVMYSYIVDKTAPEVEAITTEYGSRKLSISWAGKMEPDLLGYRVYRKVGENGTYQLIAQRKAVAGQRMYECSDANIPLEEVTCFYKVEAVDAVGNTGDLTAMQAFSGTEIQEISAPVPVIQCESVQEIGVEYIIDASASTDNAGIVSYQFDFGDGTTSTAVRPIHVYAETGDYTITLTVTDAEGNTASASKKVQVKDRTQVGTARIRVVDEEGTPVAGAPVYFDLGESFQVVRYTDGSGYVSFTGSVGKHTVGCVIPNNEWLPVKKDIVLNAGTETEMSMTLVHHTLIEGQFEINRMTFEEIVAAGIDVNDPENQHIVKINLKLTYSDEVVDQTYCFNMLTGLPVSGLGNFDSSDDDNPDGDNDSDGNKDSGDKDDDNGEGDRIYIPVLINPKNHASGAAVAVLDMPVEASFLKEFFDVRLHIINNAASEFSMLDNIITLNVPEGLTIMDTVGTEHGAQVRIPEIAGQSTETIQWILRGDEEGEYLLSADYTGTLSEFDEQINTRFEAGQPIKVYGLGAVKLIATINTTINYDAFYFDLAIENIGGADIYMPSIKVTDDILDAFLYRIGKEGEVESGTVREPKIRHLNTVLSNKQGFSQNIGTQTEVNALSPGSTMTNKYAVYNAVGHNDILYLRDAVYEVAGGQDVQFEIIEISMDLFSTDDLPEKMAALNGSNKSMYDYIAGGQNFCYVEESLDRDDNILQQISEGVYGAAKLVLNLDANYNKDETRELTRKLVAQLLIDESMQQAIDLRIDTKYLDVTNKVLGTLNGIASENRDEMGFRDSDAEILTSIISDGAKVRSLAETMQSDGYDGFFQRLMALGISSGIGVGVNWSALSDGLQESGILREAFADACSELGDVLGDVQKVFSAWNTSAEITSSLISIAAAQEEATNLLNMLIENTDSGTAINDELCSIRTAIKNANAQMGIQFADQLGKLVLNQLVGAEVKAILACMEYAYGINFGAIYTLVKVVFGAVDFVFDWGGSIEDLHVLRVNTEVSFALEAALQKYGLKTTDTNESLYTLSALKYLIKMRLIGERSYAKIINGESKGSHDAALERINDSRGTEYTTLDEYVENMTRQLLTYRDNIFSTHYEDISIPEAPSVTIDYLTGATVESFSYLYEYSFEGTRWYDCNGEPISLDPGTGTKWLWVRLKATAENLSGNVTKVMVPARPRITGDISVLYSGSDYQVRGLKSGDYFYTFTNDRNTESLTGYFSAGINDVIRLQEAGDWTYLAIGRAATEEEFVSQIRYLVTETCEHADCLRVVTEATCTEAGYTRCTCNTCGASFETDYVEPLGHGYSEWAISRAPGCLEAGEERRDCERCDHFETREAAAEGHKEVIDGAVDATCTETGLTEGRHCAVCDEVLTAQTVIPAKGHSYGDWVITVEPTCTGEGIERADCTDCDYFETQIIEPVGHTEAVSEEVEATCTESGWTGGVYCLDCGEVLVVETVVPAKGHSYGNWVVTLEPTCTKEGSERRDCANCDHFETQTIKATGHTEVIDKAEDATCTEIGLTEGKHCSVCGEVLVAQTVIPAEGHSYSNWVVTAEPTCTKDGTEHRDCANCDHFETQTIKATGHTETIDKAVEPTCTETGLMEGKHCSVCGEVLTAQTVIPAKGHSFGNWVVTVEPTCTKEGTERRDCANCDHFETQAIEAKGHTGVIDKAVEATCTETGLTEGKHCSVCGEILAAQEEIPATGHTFEGDICVDCGEKKPFEAGALTAKSATVSLEDVVYVNFYFTYTDGDLTQDYLEENGGILIWQAADYPGDDLATYDHEAVEISAGLKYVESNGRYMGRTDGIPLRFLNDTLVIRGYVELPDGTYLYSASKDYSGRIYAQNRINTIDGMADPSNKLIHERDLSIALLNSIAQAQIYFEYNTHDLANSSLSEERKAMQWSDDLLTPAAKVDENKTLEQDKAVFTKRSATLNLVGKTEINFYFAIPDATKAAAKDTGILFWTEADYRKAETLDSASATYDVEMAYYESNNRWGAAYPVGFASSEYEETVYACAYLVDSNGEYHYSGLVSYSVEQYCANQIKNNKPEATLSKQLVIYGEAAQSYFS